MRGKSKGGDTTTRTEFETAGSWKDLGLYGFGLWEPGAASRTFILIGGSQLVKFRIKRELSLFGE